MTGPVTVHRFSALAPFSLWSPRTVSLFGQVPKREMGLEYAQVRHGEQEMENGLPWRCAPRNDMEEGGGVRL
jgi:hypothetical protein